MKPITEYQDYRRYMQDFYEEKKKSGFTWREFSKGAGFASPSYLKLVCEGKSSLSRVGLPRVANAMGLSGYEFTYFEKMVEFGNATNDEKKKAAFAELTRIAKEQKARVIDSDTFAYYESAINSIVRELAPLMPGALPNEMAKRIKHLYTAQQVRDSLAMLTRRRERLPPDGQGHHRLDRSHSACAPQHEPRNDRPRQGSHRQRQRTRKEYLGRNHGRRHSDTRTDIRRDRQVPPQRHRTCEWLQEHRTGLPPQPSTLPAYGQGIGEPS